MTPGRSHDVTVGVGVIAEASAHLPDLEKAEQAFVIADRNPDRVEKAMLAGYLAVAGSEGHSRRPSELPAVCWYRNFQPHWSALGAGSRTAQGFYAGVFLQ